MTPVAGYHPFLATVREAVGGPDLDEAEAEAVLRLAAVAAHTAERKLAPLTTYLAGQAVGGAPRADRLAVIVRLTEALAATEGTEREPG